MMADYQLAACILFPIAVMGLLCNLTVVFFLRMMPSLKNSFGILTFSQALADCCHQGIFVFFVVPCIFLQDKNLYDVSHHFGFALLLFYEICGMSHVFISINRFCAVYFPLKYASLFSKSNTIGLVLIYWTFGTVYETVAMNFTDCEFYIPHGTWFYIFRDTPICYYLQWYGDFLKNSIFVLIVAVLDISSILRIHYGLNKNLDAASALRRSRQMNLVYQAALQGIFFITELITYFLLSGYARNKWEAYALTTVSWCLVNAMDGFIVLVCNRDFRRQICKAHSISVIPTGTINSNLPQ